MLCWLLICLWQLLGDGHPDGSGCHRVKSSARTRSLAKPAWVQSEIVRLKALMPEAGCRLIADTFNRRFARHAELKRRASVGKSFVAETIRQHRYEIVTLRRTIKHRVPPPVPRNLIWAMDLTGKGDGEGRIHSILGVIDHGTRALLALRVLSGTSSWTLLGHLFLAIGKYGKPKAIRTDNGSVFVSRVFRAVLALAGVRHQRSAPACPWQNGRIERLFGTLKDKLDRMEVNGFDALSSLLGEFHCWYNHVRPHQHLQGRTPAEAWSKIDPYAKPVKQEFWFEAWEGLLCGFYLRR